MKLKLNNKAIYLSIVTVSLDLLGNSQTWQQKCLSVPTIYWMHISIYILGFFFIIILKGKSSDSTDCQAELSHYVVYVLTFCLTPAVL